MTDIELPPEVELLVLAELQKRVAARIKTTKAVIGQRYPDGRKETFRSPLDDRKLGIVYRTDPDPVWKVTDREALHAELRQFPGSLETVTEITDEAAAVEVLREHAPHLLADITRVSDSVVDAALAQSEATGTPAAAGIERVKPAGVLTVTVDKAAGGPAIDNLHEHGVITWDGRPALTDQAEAS